MNGRPGVLEPGSSPRPERPPLERDVAGQIMRHLQIPQKLPYPPPADCTPMLPLAGVSAETNVASARCAGRRLNLADGPASEHLLVVARDGM